MQFETKLTLDGLMTLVAGIIAFAAVIIQIRSSSKQLHDQMKTQRDAEREEQERLKKAVATAILFEIDSVYSRFVGFVEDRSLPRDALGTDFPVFAANAGQLGLLHQEAVAVVVRFYGAVSEYALTAVALTARLRNIADKEVSLSLGNPRVGTILGLREGQSGTQKLELNE